MAQTNGNAPTDPEVDSMEESSVSEPDLSDEIAQRWDPEQLLRLVSKRAGRGERLDETTRSRYERRFGVDLGSVRVYSGPFAQEFTKARNAEAVTIGGTGMVLMGGSPDKSMATRSGEALLAHELTHVAQDQRGLHYSTSFGSVAALGTEEDEQEAEETEAEILEYGTSSAGSADDQGASQQLDEQRRDKIIQKVLEMYAEAHRIDWIRNGSERYRP